MLVDLYRRIGLFTCLSFVSIILTIGCSKQKDEKDNAAIYQQFDSLIDRSVAMEAEDLGRALAYSNQAIELANYLEDESKTIQAKHQKGIVFTLQGKLFEALDLYMQVLDYHKEHENWMKAAKTANNIGIFYANCDYEQALKYYVECNKYFELAIKNGADSLVKGNVSINNIGVCYDLLEKYDSALFFYKEYERSCLEYNDIAGLAMVNHNMGTSNGYLGNYEKAVHYLR